MQGNGLRMSPLTGTASLPGVSVSASPTHTQTNTNTKADIRRKRSETDCQTHTTAWKETHTQFFPNKRRLFQ